MCFLLFNAKKNARPNEPVLLFLSVDFFCCLLLSVCVKNLCDSMEAKENYSMPIPAFDTHKFVLKLKDAGFNAKQAEALVALGFSTKEEVDRSRKKLREMILIE